MSVIFSAFPFPFFLVIDIDIELPATGDVFFVCSLSIIISDH